MQIRDFHRKFVSCKDQCDLLTALRKLSRIEDPQAMSGDDGTASEWIVWSDAGDGAPPSLAGI